jgi:hypothetical protein
MSESGFSRLKDVQDGSIDGSINSIIHHPSSSKKSC